MPRTIRWQSQLIVHETLYDELNIGESMEDLDLITSSLLRLSTFIEALPDDVKEDMRASIGDIRALIDAERAKLVVEVDTASAT